MFCPPPLECPCHLRHLLGRWTLQSQSQNSRSNNKINIYVFFLTNKVSVITFDCFLPGILNCTSCLIQAHAWWKNNTDENTISLLWKRSRQTNKKVQMNILAKKCTSLVVCPRNISITALITNLGVECFMRLKYASLPTTVLTQQINTVEPGWPELGDLELPNNEVPFSLDFNPLFSHFYLVK